MSDREPEDLRRQLAACERGRGKRYPAALQRRITGWAQREIERGTSARAVAARIGLHPATLQRWLDDRADDVALVPVEMTAAPASPAQRIVVVSPTGFRIEGLSLDEIAALLRVLG